MNFNLKKLRNINFKCVAFWVILTVVVFAVSVLAVNKWHDLRESRDRKVAAQQEREHAAVRAQTLRDAQRQADISRLVSYCMESQQTFDKLTVKEKTGRVRPNCTIAE